MSFDTKEHANWLVNHGVPVEKLACPMCGGIKLGRAMKRAAIYQLDNDSERLAVDPTTGINEALIAAAISCENCGFLRLFLLEPDHLPRHDPSIEG